MVPEKTDKTVNGRKTVGPSAETVVPAAGGAEQIAGQASWRSALDIIAAFAMLLVAGVTLWTWYHHAHASPSRTAASPRPTVPVPTQPVSLQGLPLLGAPSARAAMLIFSDFECPYCARFANETMPEFKKRYVDTGLVRVGFRHLPLPIHSRAERAAASTECAAQQGQFWAMHDALFSHPLSLEERDLTSKATAIGLDSKKFEVCMRDSSSDRVKRDVEIAQRLGLRATPSFIVGKLEGGALHATSVVVGMRSVDAFKEVLDGLLSVR